MKTPLRYPGGKSRALKHILPLVPSDITELCSPFLGGGSVELKLAQRGVRVYGYDIFTPLVWFWQALLRDPVLLAATADSFRVHAEYEYKGDTFFKKGLPVSDFKRFREEIKEELCKDTPQFSYDLAAKVYAINRSSFSGATLSGGFSKRASYARFTDSSIERVRNFKQPSLSVERLDFRESISMHPNTFLYLDPPYMLEKDRSALYGTNGDTHKGFPHRALYEAVSVRDNWLLSYNDCIEIRELYKDYEIINARWSYGMKNINTKKMGSSSEILIKG